MVWKKNLRQTRFTKLTMYTELTMYARGVELYNNRLRIIVFLYMQQKQQAHITWPLFLAVMHGKVATGSKQGMYYWARGGCKGGAKGALAPSMFGTTRTSAFSTNTQWKFVSVVLDAVLGPPHLAWHTWWCPWLSVVPEATHEESWGPLKGAVSAQKSPSRVQDGDEGVAGRNRR